MDRLVLYKCRDREPDCLGVCESELKGDSAESLAKVERESHQY